MSKEFLTVERIANELGLSEETVLRWIRKKELELKHNRPTPLSSSRQI